MLVSIKRKDLNLFNQKSSVIILFLLLYSAQAKPKNRVRNITLYNPASVLRADSLSFSPV